MKIEKIKKIASFIIIAAFKDILKDSWDKNDIEKFKDNLNNYLALSKSRFFDAKEKTELQNAIKSITHNRFSLDWKNFALLENGKPIEEKKLVNIQ